MAPKVKTPSVERSVTPDAKAPDGGDVNAAARRVTQRRAAAATTLFTGPRGTEADRYGKTLLGA